MEEIIGRYYVALYAFCLSKKLDAHDSKDILQLVFSSFDKSYYKKVIIETKIKNLLFTITNNKINDHFRAVKRRRDLMTKVSKDIVVNDLDKILARFAREEFIKIYYPRLILTATERTIWHAIFKLDASPEDNKEISKLTGLNIKKVKNSKKTLFEKIRNLRTCMDSQNM